MRNLPLPGDELRHEFVAGSTPDSWGNTCSVPKGPPGSRATSSLQVKNWDDANDKDAQLLPSLASAGFSNLIYCSTSTLTSSANRSLSKRLPKEPKNRPASQPWLTACLLPGTPCSSHRFSLFLVQSKPHLLQEVSPVAPAYSALSCNSCTNPGMPRGPESSSSLF